MIDPLLGQTLDGRYEVVSRLANGGMATVYVADDKRLGRRVAVKVIHPHLAEDEHFTARFQREARSAARVSHGSVVPVFDQGTWRGRSYLVMELVDGTTLRSALGSGSPLQLGQALECTTEILEAVGAAHSVGVVHRDLKPENVLVSNNGQLRVVDFGLARATGESFTTGASSVLGTAAYVAPEAFGPTPVDDRADVYAAGIMLYEMLTGELPWPPVDRNQTVFAHVHEDVPAPSDVVPWLPPEVDALVAALCARDPRLRVDAAAGVDLVAATSDSLPDTLLRRTVGVAATPTPDTENALGEPTGTTELATASAATSVFPIAPQLVHTTGSGLQTLPGKTMRRTTVLVLLAVTLLLAGTATAAWWWLRYGPGAYQEMPELTGMTGRRAEQVLNDRNLQFEIREDHSDEIAEGNVISTIPEAGSRVHRDDYIEIVVSLGVQMVEVPELVGLTEDVAINAIADADLLVGETTRLWSDTVPAGNVIRTNPPAARTVPHQTEIDLVVSRGPEPVTVDSVVGLPAAQAREILLDSGLRVTTTTSYSDETPVGLVVSQEPEASTQAHRGDNVRLVLSLGPQQLLVPNVVGMDADLAEAILTEAGFQVEISHQLSWFGGDNTVQSQQPNANSRADSGSKVTISVR